MVLAALAGLAIAVAGGYFLTKQITEPLRAFVDVMRLMQSTGDFDMRIDLHPEDKDMPGGLIVAHVQGRTRPGVWTNRSPLLRRDSRTCGSGSQRYPHHGHVLVLRMQVDAHVKIAGGLHQAHHVHKGAQGLGDLLGGK